METLRVGDPLDKSTDIGAIVAAVQFHRIRELVEERRAEGGRLWQPEYPIPTAGCSFRRPCSPASSRLPISEGEIFGPVRCR